jgi:hypothetical protein
MPAQTVPRHKAANQTAVAKHLPQPTAAEPNACTLVTTIMFAGQLCAPQHSQLSRMLLLLQLQLLMLMLLNT